jgi:hypothetical protein
MYSCLEVNYLYYVDVRIVFMRHAVILDTTKALMTCCGFQEGRSTRE